MNALRFLRGLFLVALVVSGLLAVSARGQDAAAQFPEAQRVVADYPDAVQSYVALNFLWEVLHEKSLSAAAVSKRGTYYNASESIRTQQLVKGDAAATAFNDRVRELTGDKAFREGVLAKYHLANVPVEAAQPRNTDVTDAMIKGATFKALPFALAALIAMIFITKVMVRNTTNNPSADARMLTADGLPSLPEALRVVRVPGLEYTIGVQSGMVLDKETTMKTEFQTTTTQGQAYKMGNEIHVQPGRTTTTARTTQTDLIWLQTPDKRETSWTFTGGSFKTRPGHLISAIVRCLPGGTMQFLMAYNHTTSQFDVLGAGSAHGTRRGRWAWVVASLVGGVGFGIAIWVLLSIRPPETPQPLDKILYPVSLFLEGLVVAAILEFFIVLRAKAKVWQRRNESFERNYMPGLRQFLEQRSAALEKHFGN